MQSRKPSPALVVSIVALVVALSGTAVAAKILITSSAQIKNRTISGLDLKDGAITRRQIANSTLQALAGTASPGGTAAIEAHRQSGPDMPNGGSTQILDLALTPGVYAVFAKTTITPFVTDNGLLNTLAKDNKTIGAECTLDVNGTGDFAISPVVSPGSTNPTTVNVQVTRTLDAPGKATLTCKVDQAHWQAANTSIIALKVNSSTRTETP
ncbi:MAG: hypothetical protein JWM73_1399 [Solirubrobacterales bacterium]|jgi:hypothetical protein|nr:hypothetical protein [Solirubrobacterales bacterium]